MGLWPMVKEKSYGVMEVIALPRLCVSTATITKGCITPLHVHNAHDQLIHIVRGEVVLQLGDERKTKMPEKSVVIIPAKMAHSFSAITNEARIMTVFMGDGAEQPGKAALPEKVRSLIEKGGIDMSFTQAVLNAPVAFAKMHGLSETETQTLLLALQNMKFEEVSTKKHEIRHARPKRQNIRGWIKGDTFYLGAYAIQISLKVIKNAGLQYATKTEDILVREISWFPPASSMQIIPVLK